MSDRQYLEDAAGDSPQKPAGQQSHNPAANLARQKVEHAYNAEPTQAGDQTPHIMREQPYDWDKYHTAWQQYYHQYFYRYYADWWQQQQKTASAAQPAPLAEGRESTEHERVADELRGKVRSTVSSRAKKLASSSHFKPVLAALTVAILFLFVNYNQVLIGSLKQYVAPGSNVTTPVIVEPGANTTASKEPKIIIPKIGVEAPVVYDELKVDEPSFQKALERGVVRLGTTADPGTKGNIVIGGHSSNNVFNPGKYKYVFVNLKRLDVNDIIYLNFNGKRYTYKVTVAKKVVTPKDTSALAQTDSPMLTLFTCDPPGTNVNRLIVQGVQIDPNPDSAIARTTEQTAVNKTNPLPSVAPSFWDWLFRR